DIDITLDDEQSRELHAALAHFVHPVEFAALVEQRRLGRIEVLRLALADHAPAEGDHAPARIADREHQPVAEAVVMAFAVADLPALAFDDEPEFGELADLAGIAPEAAQHVVPGIGRKTELEASHRFG